MNKLKPTLLDRVLNKNKYKKIIYLRTQINDMCDMFDKMGVIFNIDHEELSAFMFNKQMYSLNERSMFYDLGEKAVIDRLKDDRNDILKELSLYKEFDLSYIKSQIRDEKINDILNYES